MANGDHIKASLNDTVGRASQWQVVWQRLSVSLLLVLGILVFLTAAGVDSLQQAVAADMTKPAIAIATPDSINLRQPELASDRVHEPKARTETYLDFNPETAQRLRQSDLLSSQLIRSRLTSAHLFPSLAQ